MISNPIKTTNLSKPKPGDKPYAPQTPDTSRPDLGKPTPRVNPKPPQKPKTPKKK